MPERAGRAAHHCRGSRGFPGDSLGPGAGCCVSSGRAECWQRRDAPAVWWTPGSRSLPRAAPSAAGRWMRVSAPPEPSPLPRSRAGHAPVSAPASLAAAALRPPSIARTASAPLASRRPAGSPPAGTAASRPPCPGRWGPAGWRHSDCAARQQHVRSPRRRCRQSAYGAPGRESQRQPQRPSRHPSAAPADGGHASRPSHQCWRLGVTGQPSPLQLSR